MRELVLDKKQKESLMEFVAEMKAAFGDGLLSLCLYGEGAGEPAHQPHHRLRLLAVMKEAGYPELSRYAGMSGRWLKKGLGAPLMLTPESIESSTDVFPMEFFEMKEGYVLLHGTDYLAGLEVPPVNLRLQLEEQVKGKLLHLRQAYMESGGDKGAIAGLISASIGPFIQMMRNALRIKGLPIPAVKDVVIGDCCRMMGLDDKPFRDALALRHGTAVPSKDALEALFRPYMDGVSAMAEFIDKMSV